MILPYILITLISLCFAAFCLAKAESGRLPVTAVIAGGIGVIAQGLWAFHSIEVYQLSTLAVVFLVAWLNVVVVLFFMPQAGAVHLAALVFGFDVIVACLQWLAPSASAVVGAGDTRVALHIVLSLLTMSVLCLAFLQGALLWLQDVCLRRKAMTPMMLRLAPIETMESLLFQLIWFGFCLLTILLATSFLFHRQALSSLLYEKALLGICSWGVFALLLLGRALFGWRGRTAIRWSQVGLALLLLSYFGTRWLAGY